MSPTRRTYNAEGNGKRNLRLEIRLNQEELDKIQACANNLSISKAEAILKGIELLAKVLEV